MKRLKLIVCCDNERGIGKNNIIPWTNKDEMKIFKNKTIGKGNNCVIMGSKTFHSLPERHRPLKQRKNVVISSRMKPYEHSVIEIITSHYEIIDMLKQNKYDEYWLIGGAYIYDLFLKFYKFLIDEVHMSMLNVSYDCDRFFPKINQHEFTCVYKKHYNDTFTHFIYKNKSYL
jgi:dihydrofolate reductase